MISVNIKDKTNREDAGIIIDDKMNIDVFFPLDMLDKENVQFVIALSALINSDPSFKEFVMIAYHTAINEVKDELAKNTFHQHNTYYTSNRAYNNYSTSNLQIYRQTDNRTASNR
jgi:hypothetical protein